MSFIDWPHSLSPVEELNRHDADRVWSEYNLFRRDLLVQFEDGVFKRYGYDVGNGKLDRVVK